MPGKNLPVKTQARFDAAFSGSRGCLLGLDREGNRRLSLSVPNFATAPAIINSSSMVDHSPCELHAETHRLPM
jgi:hypothetical protein